MKKVIRILIRIAAVVATVLLLCVGIVTVAYFHRSNPKNVIRYESNNPFISNEPLISAHRSGGGINPEETMMAFQSCVEDSSLGVSIFEFDLHITKDDDLVVLHDTYLDRTANVEEIFGQTNVRAEDKTTAELKQLNMGAFFIAEDGSMPYADLSADEVPDSLRIVTLSEVLGYLSSVGDYQYIIEIKNSGELGEKAVDILYRTLQQFGLTEKVVVGSFHENVAHYIDNTYPDLYRGAYAAEVIDFILAAFTDNEDYAPAFDVLQLPFGDAKESYYLNLGTTSLINYAHKHQLAVQYWTINREKDMEYLWSIGADCIMSDYPNIASEVLQKMMSEK